MLKWLALTKTSIKFHIATIRSKLLGLAVTPRLWPIAALGVIPALAHSKAFRSREFDVVIDVGSNKGQFASFAAWRWPKAQLICFEPLAKPRGVLSQVLKYCAPERSVVHPYALGESSRSGTIYVTSREDSSSLLKITDLQRTIFHMDEVRREAVTIKPLDEIFADPFPGKTLLKIDVQGFEYRVLLGALSCLEWVNAIYVEISFKELYEGQELAYQVKSLLEKHGFRENYLNINYFVNKEPIQADVLFTREPSHGHP